MSTTYRTSRLSAREVEILRHAADGYTYDQIGAAVRIATSTVRTHIGNIIRSLDARNTTHAVAIGYREGILGAVDREDVELVRYARTLGYRIALVPCKVTA